MTTRNVAPKPTHHRRVTGLVSTIMLILSVIDAKVCPAAMTGVSVAGAVSCGMNSSSFSRDAESSERSAGLAAALCSEDSASRLNVGQGGVRVLQAPQVRCAWPGVEVGEQAVVQVVILHRLDLAAALVQVAEDDR